MLFPSPVRQLRGLWGLCRGHKHPRSDRGKPAKSTPQEPQGVSVRLRANVGLTGRGEHSSRGWGSCPMSDSQGQGGEPRRTTSDASRVASRRPRKQPRPQRRSDGVQQISPETTPRRSERKSRKRAEPGMRTRGSRGAAPAMAQHESGGTPPSWEPAAPISGDKPQSERVIFRRFQQPPLPIERREDQDAGAEARVRWWAPDLAPWGAGQGPWQAGGVNNGLPYADVVGGQERAAFSPRAQPLGFAGPIAAGSGTAAAWGDWGRGGAASVAGGPWGTQSWDRGGVTADAGHGMGPWLGVALPGPAEAHRADVEECGKVDDAVALLQSLREQEGAGVAVPAAEGSGPDKSRPLEGGEGDATGEWPSQTPEPPAAEDRGHAPPAGPRHLTQEQLEEIKESLLPRTTPFTVGNVTVVSLGRIDVDKSSLTGPHGGYGTRYVWPIGFKSRRPYMSVENPAKRIWYESEIHVDDRTGNPWFTVRALDGSGLAFDGANPTQAWHKVLDAVNAKTGTRERVAVSGPQFLGLSDPIVSEEVAKLPGYLLCRLRQQQAAAPAGSSRRRGASSR